MRVLLADDHPVFRQGLRVLLEDLGVDVRAGADEVELEVTDDGRGLPAQRVAGVGLASMTERAAELGGRCSVDPRASGGTRVRAVIPRPVVA